MDLATLSNRELEELQEGTADLLLALSVERVRRMPCCSACETASTDGTLRTPLVLEVIHE